ncbi:MAG: oligosaccharide flippase family protein [Phycisphaerales bacterium]
MTLRTIVTGAGTLTAGRTLSQALALARHVIIGRLLSPHDLGIAALLMVTSAMLELMTQFSVDKLLVQASDGDEAPLQGAAQLFLSARGVVMGIAALVLATPLAGLFDIPEAAWAFAAFGAAPIIAGLRHLDCKRAHRDGRFLPDMVVEVVPQAIVTAAAWPVIAGIGGYAGVLWLLVLKAALGTAMSHAVASRSYGWSWSVAPIRRILLFGWPLLMGSALLFLVTQGDQLIVGSGYSMHTLGLYAVAATIALALGTMIASVSSTLMLPVLAARSDDRDAFARAHASSVVAHALLAAAVGIALIASGSAIVETLYGARYAPAGGLLGWLAVMQAVRLMRVSPTVACVARADTISPMIANVCRAAVLPAAVGVAAAGLGLVWIIVVGVAGETLALVVLGFRARRKHGIDVVPTFAATAVLLAVFGIVMSGTAVLGPVPGVAAAGVLAIGIATLGFVARDRWARPAAAFRWIPAAPDAVGSQEAA